MYLVNNLLNQETFKAFNFSNDFNEVCEQNDLDGISSGEYILLKNNPDDFLKILMKDNHVCYLYLEEILISSEHSLAIHGLYPAKRLTQNRVEENHHSIMKDYNIFCQTIFQKEYYWLKQFLNWTHHYLDKRIAFGETLTKHESIKFTLSEVIENMAIAHVILKKKYTSSQELKIFF